MNFDKSFFVQLTHIVKILVVIITVWRWFIRIYIPNFSHSKLFYFRFLLLRGLFKLQTRCWCLSHGLYLITQFVISLRIEPIFLKHLENLVKSVSIYTFFIIHIFHVTFVLFQFLIVYRFSLYFLINLVQKSISPLNLIIKELTECFIFKNHLGALDFINVLIQRKFLF